MTEKLPIRILYDGNCPICCGKMRFLQKRDRQKNLRFIDVQKHDFSAAEFGLTPEQANYELHAVLPDETVLGGMDALRAAYRAIGLGWLLIPTTWPLLRHLSDAAYRNFAHNRLFLSTLLRKDS